MKRRLSLLLFLAILLTACAAAPSETATARPTETPTLTPTPKVEATATVRPVSADELGMKNQDFFLGGGFSGALPSITREKDNSYTVIATGYTAQGEKTTQKYTLVEGSFSQNPEIKNGYAPATAEAYTLDARGERVNTKLIWDGENGRWLVPLALVADKNLEKIDQHPFIPDGEQKLALQSALLYFKDNPPFTEAAVESYKKFGGNSLLFDYYKDGSKRVLLKSKGNDNINATYDSSTLKASDLWVWQEINGVREDFPLLTILDPKDPENPQKDEFKVIFALRSDPIDLTSERRPERIKAIIKDYYDQNRLNYILLYLYGNEEFLKANPRLAYLLGLPGNDPSKLKYIPGYFDFPSNLEYMDELSPTNPLIEVGDPVGDSDPLRDEIQLMRFLYALGVRP